MLRTYLTRLRRALGAAGRLVHTEPEGYRLAASPDRVDALRFARLLRRDDQSTEYARLVEALALWRGTPFDDVRSGWLARYESPRLVERYLAAIERRADLDLLAGRHHELVPELLDLTGRHPLRESLWRRLLVALDLGGRRAEALERYEAIRARLAEELGSDPGPELRRVHADLLAGRPPQLSGATPEGHTVPRQLPADIDGFAGRAESLEVYHSIDDRSGEANAANGAGWCHAQLGEFDDALAYCQRALALHQACGNRRGEANTWDSLGNIHHQLGDRERATASYRQAITLFREVGNHYDEAATLVRLGDMQVSVGDTDAGRTAWHEALGMLEALDHPFADQVRTKLKLNGSMDRGARSGRAAR